MNRVETSERGVKLGDEVNRVETSEQGVKLGLEKVGVRGEDVSWCKHEWENGPNFKIVRANLPCISTAGDGQRRTGHSMHAQCRRLRGLEL